ncbi:MAG: SpoIIE family protein phosphatase [Candidatus Neomarinimicrobiota bacterium]
MNKINQIFILVISIFSLITANPQKGNWKQYDYTSGISSNYIFDVEKDSQSRVWVGTQNGITLIDGKKIKKYGLSHGLPPTNIIKVVSVNDIIYAATSNKGIYYLNENDMFQKADFIQGDKVYTMNAFESKLFISTKLENVLYDGQKVSFMGNGFPKSKIRDLFLEQNRAVFVADQELIRKKGNKYVTEKIRFGRKKVKIKKYVSFQGVDYFGTNKGLWSRTENNNPTLISNEDVLSLEHNKSNVLFVGTKKGLYFLRNGKLLRYNPKQIKPAEFEKIPINDISFVNNNEIWYATFGGGLFLHDIGSIQNFDLTDGLNSGGMVFDMVNWKGKTYIATKNGLFVFTDGIFSKHFKKEQGLPSNIILDLDTYEGINFIWLATSNGISKFDGSNFINYSKSLGLPAKLVTAIHIDRKNSNTVWTGSEKSGLTRFDGDGFFNFATQDGLPSNSIRDISQSENGDLIIACYNAGVARYDGKSFKLFNKGLADKRVILVTNGPQGSTWAGTESAGIGILKNNEFEMVIDSDGLGHNEIFSLYNDGQRMWAGTFGGGVSCFSDGLWFTMSENDGLSSNNIGAIVAKGNKILLGGNKGLSIFEANSTQFKLKFDKILTPNAEVSFTLQMTELSGIVKDRFFMTANPLIYNPANSEIRYRFKADKPGELSRWSKPQLSSQISFVPEEVGSYDFQVQAIDNRLRTSKIVNIPFKVSRIWYLDPKTAIPFWGGIFLLIGISIVNYINYRKKSIEAKELRDAEIARQQAEMEEAREFQQAMLPNEMPSTDDYEMVGFQQTATEVGGDFFDFMQKEDGGWVAICGDATGHGLTSGNVVSITKTAMSSLIEEPPVPTLDSLNATLLKMNIGLNRMCLNIANIGKDSIKFSSAGMPPAYYYSADKGELEEILVGALPLGSLPGAMHMEQEISFKNSGDIIVMMSDGLPEAENDNKEMVGYERTEEKIRELADKSAEEIKNGLVDLCNNWLKGNAELQDDMTFVIIKKK